MGSVGDSYDNAQQRRVWATGYVDQLLARYRDEIKAGGRSPGRGSGSLRTAGLGLDGPGEPVADRRSAGRALVRTTALERARRAPRAPSTISPGAPSPSPAAGDLQLLHRALQAHPPRRRAFGSETYVVVDADSERAHQVLDTPPPATTATPKPPRPCTPARQTQPRQPASRDRRAARPRQRLTSTDSGHCGTDWVFNSAWLLPRDTDEPSTPPPDKSASRRQR
jgi:hypothetical protein